MALHSVNSSASERGGGERERQTGATLVSSMLSELLPVTSVVLATEALHHLLESLCPGSAYEVKGQLVYVEI